MCRGQQSELPDHSPSLQQGWGHWSASLGLHVPPPRGGGAEIPPCTPPTLCPRSVDTGDGMRWG